jgi:GNAT superfamily N-acetyltransferase
MKVVEFPVTETVESYPLAPSLPRFDPATLGQHRADAHYLVIDTGEAVARASLWWRDVPALEHERLGVIGHFAARDVGSAALLLSQISNLLAAQGCTLAVGPMDCNTWHRYRFVTDAGSEPSFFLEPENPPAYPQYFLGAGFVPMAEYTSALVTELDVQDVRIPRAVKRLRATGVKWRPLDMNRFEHELKAIYRLSVQSFTQNHLYTPISETEFLAQYKAVVPYLQPELTLMAEHQDELLGYLFGVPDLNQAQRGEAVDTFIVKTVAALPGRRSAGLGSVLVAESHRIAHERGYRRAIHALMHQSNKSQNISAHYSNTMRCYTLFQLCLGPGK